MRVTTTTTPTILLLLLIIIVGCASHSLLANTANGEMEVTIDSSPYEATDTVYNTTNDTFVASVNVDTMVSSAPLVNGRVVLIVNMSRFTIGYTNAVRTNTVLINGSSSNTSTTSLLLTITDWQFLAGGSLKFMGHFAPGSVFDISNIRTVGTSDTTPIYFADFYLWGSTFIIHNMMCNVNEAVCIHANTEKFVLSGGSSFTVTNYTGMHVVSRHSITVNYLQMDNQSTFAITDSNMYLPTPYGNMGLVLIYQAQIYNNSLLNFSNNALINDPASATYLINLAYAQRLDVRDSTIIVRKNTFPSNHVGIYTPYIFIMYARDGVFMRSTLLITENNGDSISIEMGVTSELPSNITGSTFDIYNNTVPSINVKLPPISDTIINIVDNRFGCCRITPPFTIGILRVILVELGAAGLTLPPTQDHSTNASILITRNTLELSRVNPLGIISTGNLYNSKIEASHNAVTLGSEMTHIGVDIELMVLYSSSFIFAHNSFKSGWDIALLQKGYMGLGGLRNNSQFSVNDNIFNHFGNFRILFNEPATISENSHLSIANNNFTGELPLTLYINAAVEGGITMSNQPGTRVVLHDHSSININYNTVNYTSPTRPDLLIFSGISTCITPILSHFSHFDVSHNTVVVDIVVIPQTPLFGIGVESCVPTVTPTTTPIPASARKHQIQASSEDYSAVVNPEALADRCDIPLDYNDLHTNPGMPIVPGDLSPDSQQWGVILLAASKMSIDNNTVMIRGHAHYDTNNGPVATALVTSIALPDSVRITAGSSTTSRINHVNTNVSMFPSMENEEIDFLTVGISTSSSVWIGDNGIADVSDNYIVVSSPFSSWGIHSVPSTPAVDTATTPPPFIVGYRRMAAAATTTTTIYPTINMPQYFEFDQSPPSPDTTVTVVGCNSSYNINRNMVNVSGVVGTGGIALSPSKIGVSTAGVLSIAMNTIQPSWNLNTVPDYLLDDDSLFTPTTTTTTTGIPMAFTRSFQQSSSTTLKNFWVSLGIAVGGNPIVSQSTTTTTTAAPMWLLSRNMQSTATTPSKLPQIITTKALYNGTINVSNNNIYLSRHTDPTIAGSEGGILCVGDLWMRSSSKLSIGMNTIRMDNEIISNVTMIENGELPPSVSYGVKLEGGGGGSPSSMSVSSRKMDTKATTDSCTNAAYFATSTLSQKSTISTKGNIIRGTISTGDSRKFIKFMFDEIMMYDKSYITFDGNKITNDGGVFGNAFKLEDTSISICGDSALSFSNNIISSTAAPLISSNPNDMLKYWSIWISSNKLVIAFGGLIEVINNQVSILSPSGALNSSSNSSEYGHGIHLEMPTSDIGVASLVDVSGNTVILGNVPGIAQGGIMITIYFEGGNTPSNGSMIRLNDNHVSMGCTQCHGVGINVDKEYDTEEFTDIYEINNNVVEVRPVEVVWMDAVDDTAKLVYLTAFSENAFKTYATAIAHKTFNTMSGSSGDHLPVGNATITARLNGNVLKTGNNKTTTISDSTISTAPGVITTLYENAIAIYVNSYCPRGTYDVIGNTIQNGAFSGTVNTVSIAVVLDSDKAHANKQADITVSRNHITLAPVGVPTLTDPNAVGIAIAPAPEISVTLASSKIVVEFNTITIDCNSSVCNALQLTAGPGNFTLIDSTLRIARNDLKFTGLNMGGATGIYSGQLTLDHTSLTLDYNTFVFNTTIGSVMSNTPHPDVYEAITDSYRPVDSPYLSAICNRLQGEGITYYDATSNISIGTMFNETTACPTPTTTLASSKSKSLPHTTTNTLFKPPAKTITRTLDMPNTTTTTMAPNTTNATTASASTSTSATSSMTSATTASTTTPTTTTNTTTTTPSTTVAPATCNTALAAQFAAEMPLFADFTVSMSDVRRGLVRTVTTLSTLNASYSLLINGLLESNGGRLRLRTVQMSIAGNTDGFSSQMPMATLTFINATTATINITALPSYDIAEDEALEFSVETVEMVGTMCVGTRLIAGLVTVDSEVKLYGAPSSIVTTIVSGGAAAAGMGGMSGMAAEQQALSALVMYSCSDPHSRGAFGSFRALSPFAIFESYAGVVLGNAIVMAVVAIIQFVILVVLRLCRRVRRQVELMAAARFPSLLMNVSFAFHTGTVYAASQLISLPDQFESWEVAVGAIAFTYCVLYPIFLCVHPYYRIGRAYQEYELSEWLAAKKWPAWIVHIVPQGAMYAPETRRAYGSYVSSYRAPASQVWWTSYPTWTPIIIGLGGLFHPDTIPQCQALFVALGLLFVAVAAICVWRAPLRSTTATYLNALAKLLTGLVLFCLASSVSQNGTKHASNAVFVFGIMQTGSTIIRILHSLLCSYFDRRMARENVPLSTTWTHVLGGNKKSTTQFATLDGLDLGDEASAREAGGDALLEMEDLKYDDLVEKEDDGENVSNADQSKDTISKSSDSPPLLIAQSSPKATGAKNNNKTNNNIISPPRSPAKSASSSLSISDDDML